MDLNEIRPLDRADIRIGTLCLGLSPAGRAQALTNCTSVFGTDKRLFADAGDSAAAEQALQRATDTIGPLHGSSEAEKAHFLHDWICRHLTYADSLRYRMNWCGVQTAWIGLAERVAVCTGYARSFILLCHAYSVPGIVVARQVHDGPHAWNYVKLDSSWSGVDCTWDDKLDALSMTGFCRDRIFCSGIQKVRMMVFRWRIHL